jgi:hypothetical protein
MVAEPATPELPRRRYHPHARGSKRSLMRELASVRTAMDYLIEDTGADAGKGTTAAAGAAPVPMPPDTDAGPALSAPTKIGPAKK